MDPLATVPHLFKKIIRETFGKKVFSPLLAFTNVYLIRKQPKNQKTKNMPSQKPSMSAIDQFIVCLMNNMENLTAKESN